MGCKSSVVVKERCLYNHLTLPLPAKRSLILYISPPAQIPHHPIIRRPPLDLRQPHDLSPPHKETTICSTALPQSQVQANMHRPDPPVSDQFPHDIYQLGYCQPVQIFHHFSFFAFNNMEPRTRNCNRLSPFLSPHSITSSCLFDGVRGTNP